MEAKIEQLIEAPIDKVWEAWTTADILKKWFHPDKFETEDFSVDLSVGGSWQQTMASAEYDIRFTLKGEYSVLDKPTKLVTTACRLGPDGSVHNESSYIVELREADGKTLMSFTQTDLPDEKSVQMCVGGWTEAFAKLQLLG